MKIKTISLIVVSFLLITTSALAQSNGPNYSGLEDSFELDVPYDLQNSELDSLITWQERILLHVDKPIINEETPLFFKAYTLTGPNRVRATLSKVLKLELVNKSKDVLATQYHKIENGTSEGAFIVPKKVEDGIYTLRAYTRWMQNYGESYYSTTELVMGEVPEISESSKMDDAELQVSFHPEGGELISNFSNRLLIRASSENGHAVNLSGNIIDGTGNTIMPIASYGNGMMSVIFEPKSGEQYQLKTNGGSLFKLPTVQTNGYMLNVNNLREDVLSVRVQVSPESLRKVVNLKGSMDGVTYFTQELDLKNSVMDLEIPKKGIPFGAMLISLEDENGNELSRRPIFIDAVSELNLTVLPLDEGKKDGELAFKINVTDSNGTPIETEVSFSAINLIEQKKKIQNAVDGFSWEREGLNVADGNFRRVNRFIKDLELLTGVNENTDTFSSLPSKIKYPFQKGLDLFGYVYDLNNKLLKNTKIQMLSASNNSVVIKEVETDASGRVRVENLQLVGENELVFRTEGDDSKSRIVKLVPIQESFDENRKPRLVLAKGKLNNKKGTIQTSPWEPLNSDDLIELDEVVISEDKLEQKKTLSSVYDVKPNRVRFQDVKRPKSIPQLFLGIPGVQVTGLGTLEPRVSLPRAAGAGPVLWVLDGLPLLQPTSLVEIINSVSSVDVERIEILYGAQASIYGTRAAGGAILIYTRGGAGLDYVKRKEGRIKFEGYHDSPSFDSYSEKLAKRPKRYQGKPNTLFWNPSVKTNEKGEAIVRFTPPLAYDKLEIKASAITEEGKMASVKTSF